MPERQCESCGADFVMNAVGRPRRHCSDYCRQLAHKARQFGPTFVPSHTEVHCPDCFTYHAGECS